jgi:predicted transcriptional regulator
MSVVTKILEFLSRFPDGVAQSEIAKALGVSRSYVSIVLRDLERSGLVQRVRVANTYIVRLVRPNPTTSLGNVLRLGVVWSSEYLFLGHFAKLLRDSLGVELKVLVYPNALRAVSALIGGEVDATLSPLTTLIYGFIASKAFVIVGGGAGGGGYIYEVPNSRSSSVISSEVSSMDLCRALAIKRRYIDAVESNTVYYTSADEAISIVRKGLARYAVVYHPINIGVELAGGRKVLNCNEVEELSQCCTLAVSRSLGIEKAGAVAKIYREAIEAFSRDRERYLDWYSAVIGVDVSVLKKALNEYSYSADLSMKVFDKVVDALGIEVPSRTALRKAFLKNVG